jgi:phage terminase small subunit
MAGTPGRSGGKRAGAGRKPAATVKLEIPVPVSDTLAHKDPKVFLLALMNDLEADVKVRSDAAKALLPFMHHKMGEGGKKEQQQDQARKIAGGKFAAAAPPRLVANGGKQI